MSLVDDLIRRAFEQPDELTINDSQVDALVAHYIALLPYLSKKPPREDMATHIRRGESTFMGIPVRVLDVTR